MYEGDAMKQNSPSFQTGFLRTGFRETKYPDFPMQFSIVRLLNPSLRASPVFERYDMKQNSLFLQSDARKEVVRLFKTGFYSYRPIRSAAMKRISPSFQYGFQRLHGFRRAALRRNSPSSQFDFHRFHCLRRRHEIK